MFCGDSINICLLARVGAFVVSVFAHPSVLVGAIRGDHRIAIFGARALVCMTRHHVLAHRTAGVGATGGRGRLMHGVRAAVAWGSVSVRRVAAVDATACVVFNDVINLCARQSPHHSVS